MKKEQLLIWLRKQLWTLQLLKEQESSGPGRDHLSGQIMAYENVIEAVEQQL